MPHLPRLLMAAALIASSAPPARAALDQGTLLIAPTVTAGTADFVSRSGAYLSAYEHGEIGLGGEVWYFLGDALAVSASGGVGRFREAARSATGAERWYTQRSWSSRLGADRVLQYRQDALFYFGPGVEFWRGHSNFEGDFGGGPERTQTPGVTRLSVSARFGGIMVIGDTWGIVGHVGWRVGQARAEADGAKTTWWPNGFEGGAGVVLALGR